MSYVAGVRLRPISTLIVSRLTESARAESGGVLGGIGCSLAGGTPTWASSLGVAHVAMSTTAPAIAPRRAGIMLLASARPAPDELDERPDRHARRPLRQRDEIGLRVRRSRDVEMNPRHSFREHLEEHRRGGRAGRAAA